MYSGLTLTSKSGNMFGTHQKINRVAYKKLQKSMSTKHFPELKLIQYFEGNNGPDGIKRKSPQKDEPRHFCNPNDPSDVGLEQTIESHYHSLVEHLKQGNQEKAAFEASWLAHAIVDGLTPAHHFPYIETVDGLKGERQIKGKLRVLNKSVFFGDSLTDTISKNWQFWGARGLFITHSLFEVGVAAIAALKRHNKQPVSLEMLKEMKSCGVMQSYRQTFEQVAALDMFGEFYGRGWTTKLARTASRDLLPTITETVSLFWAKALHEAGLAGKVYA